jgi:hypothetical protein
MEVAETESDTDLVRPGMSTPTSRKSRVDPSGRLSGDMWKHVVMKTVKSEHGKNKYPTRQCHVCAVHKREIDAVHLQVLPSATPQRGMFPEISLVATMAFPKNFSS